MEKNKLKFFDINFWVGENNFFDKFSTKEENIPKLLKERSNKYNISSTIITNYLSLFYSPKVGNDSLAVILDSFRNNGIFKQDIYGAMLLEHEVISSNNSFESFLIKRFNQGFKMLRLFPKSHKYPYQKNLLKEYYQVCNYYHFPIMISLDEIDITGDKLIDCSELCNISESFNYIPIIIDGGSSKALQFNSYFFLLFQNSQNIHLTTHNLYSFNQIEDLVPICHADKLIFDTYFPFSETSVSTQRLINSGLNDSDIRKIAFDNIDRIINNIQIDKNKF
jgi:hypothetical protein